MAWNDLQDSIKRAAQAEPRATSRGGIIGSIALLAAIAGVVVAAIAIPVATFGASTADRTTAAIKDLPLSLQDVPNPQTTQVLATNGKRIAYFYTENRQDVRLSAIAPIMRKAQVDIEDYRFYEHGALDLKGTLRALVNNSSDGSTQGGSTLTQQLVKMTLVQQATTRAQRIAATEKSTARKIRELKLAINFEEKYSKDEILKKYLNIAYYGDGAYGINSAAYHYFSVSPSKLTALQAATIAGLVKNPEAYNPVKHPTASLARRNVVLAAMARRGAITTDEAKKLSAKPLGLRVRTFANGCVSSMASFSCDYIQRYLLAEPALGKTVAQRRQVLQRGGLIIKSNIDYRMQIAANNAVKANVYPTDSAVGALAMVEPGTGKVRGVAQSRPMGNNTKKGQTYVNFSAPSAYSNAMGFQAGSTFKMFTMDAALSNNLPASTVINAPATLSVPLYTYTTCSGGKTPVEAWSPSNSTNVNGAMNMYRAFKYSVNTYFVQLERDAGLCNTVKAAKAMGIQVPDQDQVGSFTLGVTSVSPIDLASAYATAASGGMYCKPEPVAQIVDRTGKVLKNYSPQCTRVMSTQVAAQINDIAKQYQEAGGFGHDLGHTGLNIPSAGKTGTTQSAEAVWYMGYTPELATAAVIAGLNGKGQPVSLVGKTVKGVTLSSSTAHGSSLAGPMWAAAMDVIQNYLSPTPFATPPLSLSGGTVSSSGTSTGGTGTTTGGTTTGGTGTTTGGTGTGGTGTATH